jgi:hypothetical protein
MASRYEEIDLAAIKTVPISDRASKVSIEQFGDPVKGGKACKRWLGSLPDQLAARRIRDLARALRQASSDGEIVWMMGAHVIKCGLSRYIIELMKKGYITAIGMNGAALIHDLEIAFFGKTSEDVPGNLAAGTFGFAAETAERCFEAVSRGSADGLGLGEAAGRYILKEDAGNREASILAQAYRVEVPATVHVALGTDILAQHPGFDGALWGELSMRDFRIFAARIDRLGRAGGVALNVGSAVIMPEVFLKAFSIARNLGAPFKSLTTCNMDMIQHYRPAENVLSRPAAFGGRAISLTGHHEVMLPLLFSAILS